MNYFDTLEKKRKHVKKYHLDKIPPKECIERALWKAWKTTPSKNNAMAYEVVVWGPDMEVHKEAIHNLVVKNHKSVEDEAVADPRLPNTVTQSDDLSKGNFPNPYYEHIAFNPYLFTIHSRVSTPNKYYKKKVEQGQQYDQGDKDLFEHIIDSVAVEVGLFVGNLGYYLLEEGIDISYNSCFKREVEEWHKVGLTKVTTRPISMLSCGYAESYRKDVPNKIIGAPFGKVIYHGIDEWDKKPKIKDIITWI